MYRAFISYSQSDKRHAKRLHARLEAYRLPKQVEGSSVDPKIRKLGRIFRDDDELGAENDLGQALQGAIEQSENLIVVCSPRAAKSHWVNQEILHFKRTGRSSRIFAVIVDGRPNSSDPETECFPPALRFSLDNRGELSDVSSEPLGLDTRREPYRRILIRLIAGLLNIGFDNLWQRDRRRAQRNKRMIAGVSTTAALAGAAAIGFARLTYIESQSQLLVAEAKAAMNDGRFADALAFAYEANRQFPSAGPVKPSPDAVRALSDAYYALREIAVLDDGGAHGFALDAHPTSPRFAIGYSDGCIRFWNAEPFGLDRQICVSDHPIVRIKYSNSGNDLVAIARETHHSADSGSEEKERTIRRSEFVVLDSVSGEVKGRSAGLDGWFAPHFSPDDNFIAGFTKAQLGVWSATSGDLVATFGRFADPFASVRFDASSSILSAFTRLGHTAEVRLADLELVESTTRLRKFGGDLRFPGWVSSPDRSKVFVVVDAPAPLDPNNVLRRGAVGYIQTRISDYQGIRFPYFFEDIHAAKFNASGERLAVVSGGEVTVWDTIEGELKTKFEAAPNERIEHIEPIGERTWLAADNDGFIGIWVENDYGTNPVAQGAWRAASEGVNDVKPVFGTDLIVTAANAGESRLWRGDRKLTGTQIVWPLQASEGRRSSEEYFLRALFHRQASQVVLFDPNNTEAFVIDRASSKIVTRIDFGEDAETVFMASDNHALLASSDANGTIRIWRAEDGDLTAVIEPQILDQQGYEYSRGQSPTPIAFDPESGSLLTGDIGGTVSVWDPQSGQKIKSFADLNSPVTSVAVSGNGKIIAAATREGRLVAWNAAKGSVELDIETGDTNPITLLSMDQHGRRIAVGAHMLGSNTGRRPQVWAVKTGKRIFEADVMSAAMSLDSAGSRILSGMVPVSIWDVNRNTKIFETNVQKSTCGSYEFSSDGAEALSSCADGRVRVWSVFSNHRELTERAGELVSILDPLTAEEKCRTRLSPKSECGAKTSTDSDNLRDTKLN